MEGERFYYGWMNQTTVHPVGLAVLLCAAVAILFLPRRHAIIPILLMSCFVAPAQRVVILSLDFTFLRLLVVFGWVRVLTRGESRLRAMGTLDWAIIAWTACASVVFVVQQGSFAALVNRLGAGFDALGMYFLFRILVRGWEDVHAIIRAFIWISVPVAAAFLLEMATGRNVFASFGGVPEITVEREGRLRCQGAFAHCILAGCFWAAQIPLFVSRWFQSGSNRVGATIGLICSGVIILACSSSTPVVAVGLIVIGFALFPLRDQMRLIRWGLVAMLVALHLVMDKPVWHLFGRINLVSGSTGYHRYRLLDSAISHFGEWWLVGTKSTESWGVGLSDVTNQYLLEGVRGGVWALVLYVVLIGCAFAGVGQLLHASRNHRDRLILSWAVGVTLVAHCANFMAISYFGQIVMIWYLLLAIVGSLVSETQLEATTGAAARRQAPSRALRRHGAPAAALAVGDEAIAGESLTVSA